MLGNEYRRHDPVELSKMRDGIIDMLEKGQVREGAVKNITAFGAFIEIKEDVDGLIHVSDMSWTKKMRNPAEAFKPGDTVPAAVIEVDGPTRNLTLSVTGYFKNKEDAEWKSYLSAHKPNQATLGDVMPKLESE